MVSKGKMVLFLPGDKCAGTANVLNGWWLLLRVWKSLIVEVSSFLRSEDHGSW